MPDAEVIELSPRQHADDLRQTWQGRMLSYTHRQAIGSVVLSMLAHTFETSVIEVLLHILFPGFEGIKAPFICSAAKIDKAGRVVADVVLSDDRHVVKDWVIFYDMRRMEAVLRRLADRMKLTDRERKEFFVVAQKWVVADRRLDPNMDPADPDARRLTVH